jgi:hypothetical protein
LEEVCFDRVNIQGDAASGTLMECNSSASTERRTAPAPTGPCGHVSESRWGSASRRAWLSAAAGAAVALDARQNDFCASDALRRHILTRSPDSSVFARASSPNPLRQFGQTQKCLDVYTCGDVGEPALECLAALRTSAALRRRLLRGRLLV